MAGDIGQGANAGTSVLVGGARLNSYPTVAQAFYACGFAVLVLLFGSRALQNAIAEGDTRTISLHHAHTNEDITVTYKRNGQYDESALEKLNWFLRDWRREQETRMDPHLIDLMWEVHRETGSTTPVWVVCGYRSPETNAMLRRSSSAVARFSEHILGHAIDFYIPGVPLEELRVIGLRLQRGGVGFYPTSGSPFVHMDTGGVRHWPRLTREQLVSIFPDGRTVHIPSDGRPLPGYALALADIKARGDSPSEMSIEAAQRAGIAVADVERKRANPIAKFLGLTRDEEDEDANAAAATAPTAPSPPPTVAANAPLRTRAKDAVVAAVDRAADKLAGEKVKLVKVVSNAHLVARADAAPLATLTPNQVIIARGYWQGLPDAGPTRPAQSPANPLAAAANPPGSAADPDITGSIGLLSVAHDDRAPPGLLAYAEQPERNAPARGLPDVTVTGAAAPRATTVRIVAAQTGDNATTIAVKRVNGLPASAILTVANNKLAATPADAAQFDDPWLRAVVVSPSVSRFLCVTALGAHDAQALSALMIKPANSVMMTFEADANPALTYDHFSGSAIVFVSTVTYPMHTAALQ